MYPEHRNGVGHEGGQRSLSRMNWAAQFVEARGSLTQAEAAASISALLSVRTVEDWELGRRQPPAWVQALVLAVLRRAAGRKTARAKTGARK